MIRTQFLSSDPGELLIPELHTNQELGLIQAEGYIPKGPRLERCGMKGRDKEIQELGRKITTTSQSKGDNPKWIWEGRNL